MSQLSPTDGQERTGSSTLVSGGVVSGAGSVAAAGTVATGSGVAASTVAAGSGVAAGSVSVTPPPPEPALPARDRRAPQTSRTVELVDDELGPSLTSAQLMRSPVTERLLPDLSVSNEALLASLRPAIENTLGTRVSRVARTQGQRALYWFGTRPSWLQATLSVVGGSIVGLSLVVAYAKTFHAEPEPEIAAEPAGPSRAVALAAAAAPAALLAQSVVQPLAAAPARAVAAPAPAAPEAAAAAQPAAAPSGDAQPVAADAEADVGQAEEQPEPRRQGKRQRASQSSSGKLPSWVQQQVKPQVQRAAARERKAALREKRAAALREKKARRSRARARAQE